MSFKVRPNVDGTTSFLNGSDVEVLKIPSAASSDPVAITKGDIPYGSNAYGSYTKLPDGTFIMNVVGNVSGSIGSANGVTLTFTLPATLSNYTTAVVSVIQSSGSHFFNIPSLGYAISNTQISIQLGNTTGSARAYEINRILVIGK